MLLVASDTENIVLGKGSNWHTVVIVRRRSQAWIYDPTFNPDEGQTNACIEGITGIRTVVALLVIEFFRYCRLAIANAETGENLNTVKEIYVTRDSDVNSRCLPLAARMMVDEYAMETEMRREFRSKLAR